MAIVRPFQIIGVDSIFSFITPLDSAMPCFVSRFVFRAGCVPKAERFVIGSKRKHSFLASDPLP